MKKIILILGFLGVFTGAKADPPGIHGMVLFGKQETYLSHLPMFHSPHDYQLVMKVTLSEQKKTVIQKYKDLISQEGGLFTLMPQVMDLTKIMNGQKTFSGDIYQGHFEKGGVKLGPVTVHVESLIISKKLDPSAEELNQYTVFGKNGEYYALHEINGKPSYDAILNVSAPYTLKFTHCRTRVCADPEKIFVSDETLPISLVYADAFNGSKNPPVGQQLGSIGGTLSDVQNGIYFEEDELAH